MKQRIFSFSILALFAVALFFVGCERVNTPDAPANQDLFKISPVIEDLTTDLVLTGSGFISAGTGLNIQPGTIDIFIPADVTINQVLLYWAMRDRAPGGAYHLTGDPEITVGGIDVTGVHIGGPHTGSHVRNFSYRLDITNLGLVNTGPNSISITGLDGEFKSGAAIVVVYDDGTNSSLEIRDGLDFAWIRHIPALPELLNTNPQTFVFPSSSENRTANLTLLVGDVHGPVNNVVRPHYLEYTVGGVTTTLIDPFSAADGEEWDTYILNINIPAGETSLTVQLFSGPEDDPVDRNPSSLLWVAAALSVPTPSGEGCTRTPGYWKTHSEFGPAPYDNTWAQLPNGASTTFFLSGKTWYQAFWTTPAGGNAYYILAHAYMAAALNQLAGTSIPADVLAAFNASTTLFETYTPAQIGALSGGNALRQQFLGYASTLDDYNNGITGPGHCD